MTPEQNIMPRITKFREWLETNKVFFEVFSWIILGIMGIIVSMASLQVSRLQADLQRAQVTPSFNIQFKQAYDTEKQLYTDNVLTIANSGYSLSEFSSKVTSLYEVTRRTRSGVSTAYFPVVYLCCEFATQDSSGTLATYRQPNNNVDEIRIDREVRAMNNTKPDSPTYSVRLVNLLSLFYMDALGEKHTRRFLAWLNQGAQKIDEIEAQKWLTFYSQSNPMILDITKLSGDIFAKKFDEACSLTNTCNEQIEADK